MTNSPGPQPEPLATQSSSTRRPWTAPEVTELPRLTDLTLQTGIVGGGTTGGTPSTVF